MLVIILKLKWNYQKNKNQKKQKTKNKKRERPLGRRLSYKKIKEDKTKRPTRNNMAMPDVMSKMIHNFIRPDQIKIANRKMMNCVVADLKSMGRRLRCDRDYHTTGIGGAWVDVPSDDEWERIIVQGEIPDELFKRMEDAGFDMMARIIMADRSFPQHVLFNIKGEECWYH
tara:strand:+ start:1393 stop:1905 length:513 start_codon:yes stop_codon:yes gene_type:complete